MAGTHHRGMAGRHHSNSHSHKSSSSGYTYHGTSKEIEESKPMTYEETLRQYLKEMREPPYTFTIGELVRWKEGFELSPYNSDFEGVGIVVEINPLTIGFFDNQSGTEGHHDTWKTIEVEGYRLVKYSE